MTNKQITSKILKDRSISNKIDTRLHNKALIFCEFVTNKYATEVYVNYSAGKISAENALYRITTVTL